MVSAAIYRVALQVYRRLPGGLRRRIVRWLSPSFTVGAMCFVERDDGALLLVRHTYRDRWGVPGGLLQRGERPVDGVRREVLEEVGLDVELVGEPAVVVDAGPQRVDMVFRARPVPGGKVAERPTSPEIIESGWFLPGELPELQFETAGALVALERIDIGHRDHRVPPDPVRPPGRP